MINRITSLELTLSILYKAFRGQLVKQNIKDGSAMQLFDCVKKNRPQNIIFNDSIDNELFEIPNNWIWVKLGSLFMHNTGKAMNSSVKQNGTTRQFITTSNVYWNYFDFSNIKEMPFTDEEYEKCSIVKGDLLVCEGGDFGRSAIWDFDYSICIQNHIHRLRPYYPLCVKYFYYLLFYLKNTKQINGKGIGIQGLSATSLHNIPVPLPPLQEQERIVAKIDSILPYVERYSKIEMQFCESLENFPINLNQSILYYAIQGKMSADIKFDDKIDNTLDYIYACKKTRIKDGLIIDKKHTPDAVKEDEIPFEIPNSWKWVKLGDITTFYAGKTPERHNTSYWQNATMPWVSIADMVPNGITIDTKEKISDLAVKDCLQKCVSPKGTLIMSFKLTIGKVSYLGVDATHNEAIISIFPFAKDDKLTILKDYLFTILPFMANYGDSKNAIKGKTLNATSLTNLYIPLPSFEEQKYIVDKVKELKNLVNSLN